MDIIATKNVTKKKLFLVVLLVSIFMFVISSIRFLNVHLMYNVKIREQPPTTAPLGDNNRKFDYSGSDAVLPDKVIRYNTQIFPTNTSKINNDGQKDAKKKYKLPVLQDCVNEREIRLKFKSCSKVSEMRIPECKKVHANPDSYWRSQVKGKSLSYAEDFKRMTLASKCCAWDYPSLIDLNPRNPPFPWEKDLLCGTHELIDMQDTSWASLSSVHLQLWERDGKVMTGSDYRIGDTIKVEVIIKDGHKNIRKLGGDSVRVWLVSSDKDASVVADITDLHNGSYIATSVLPWSGKVKVKATIAHTRELFRTVDYLQRYFTSSHWFTGLFMEGGASEATPCSPFPALPAFSENEICNITNMNGGFPWFCGKPLKTELSCKNYQSARKIDYPSYFPLTEAEGKLIELTESRRPYMIPSDIEIDVKTKVNNEDATIPFPSLPCNKRDLQDTFKDSDQSGYIFAGIWRPFACKLPEVDSTFLRQCLTNTTFLYLGDSNSRNQMDLLTPQVKCVDKSNRNKKNWHAPMWCDVAELKISIRYFPPSHPFYGSVGEHVKPSVLSSAVEKMDSIPAKGKVIVHLHNFLHFMPFHLGLVETRLRRLREAAERLLKRNPEAIIVYQSTHAAYDHSRFNKHKLNVFLKDLQRNVMAGLGRRVMFANTFPISIAKENRDGHPHFSKQFLNLYMGHVCGRELS